MNGEGTAVQFRNDYVPFNRCPRHRLKGLRRFFSRRMHSLEAAKYKLSASVKMRGEGWVPISVEKSMLRCKHCHELFGHIRIPVTSDVTYISDVTLVAIDG